MVNKITVEDIRHYVCAYFDVSENDILGRSRKQNIVEARHVAIYFTSEYTDHNLKTIGLLFGGRDHSTVSSTVRKVKELRKINPKVNQNIIELNDQILNSQSSRRIQRLEKKAKKEAVRVKGSFIHNLFGTNIAKLTKPLYCFTKKELFEYKQALKNAKN